MESELCSAICQLDKAIDCTMFLTLGGIALTMIVFLSSTIAQIEDRHSSLGSGVRVTDDAMHALAQLKIGMRKIIIAWWVCVVSVVYTLTVDISIASPLIKDSDAIAHAGLLQDFKASLLPTQIDAVSSSALLAAVLCLLSYGLWLMFPQYRNVLSKGKK